MVERWFRDLTAKAIRRGAFGSVPDLEQAIADYLAAWNENPRPFIWTASVGQIVEKLARARAKLEAITPGCTQPRQRKAKPTSNVQPFQGHYTSIDNSSSKNSLGSS